MKVVVLRHDDDGPLYNPTFLAFATHYGFRPLACRPRRPQTKGKVERPFYYVETNLLNGRTFRTLEHLNEVTAWWLAERRRRARPSRDQGSGRIDRHAEEQPHLIALPASAYDTAQVVYRDVNVEGFVAYRQNCYSVPWRYIGQALPVRITEDEVIVYSPQLEEIARHRLLPARQTGQRQRAQGPSSQRRSARAARRCLRERFAELGPVAVRFLDGLLRDQRYGKDQARKVLALLGTYARDDLLAALERAVRFGAFSLARRRTHPGRPGPAQERPGRTGRIAGDAADCDPTCCDEPVPPRPTADYQHLLETDRS